MPEIDPTKTFLQALKEAYWEWSRPLDRFEYMQYFIGNLPGYLGLYWRQKLFERSLNKVGKNLTVYQGVRVRNGYKMTVGDDVYLGLDNSFQAGGGLTIGDRVAFGPGCKVWTINHKFDDLDTPIMEQGYDFKPVSIGNDVWLAANVFIMPGVEIPDGCIIAAGSVIGVKKYPPYSIISGNPARVIGNRLKNKEKEESEDKS
mgnify:CR=1 FL=1